MVVDKSYPTCNNVQIFGNVIVGAKGQIVIPNEVRKLMDINPWDSLIVTTKHGKVIWLIKSDQLEAFVAMIKEELETFKNIK